MSNHTRGHIFEPLIPTNGFVPFSECRGESAEQYFATTVIELFERQVASGAERTAVAFGNDRLSYGELNSRANRLARYLRARGARPETLIAICLDRSLEMAIGILAILKSGAAYLPVDPDYPAERISWMINDSGAGFILTSEKLAAQLPSHSAELACLDAEHAEISASSDENLSDGPKPESLAYVIYTSGSTGQPKGVMITHGSLANYVQALQKELELNDRDLYLHTASISFSSSRRQLLLPLSQGATVVIASSEQRKDPLALLEMIKAEGVTVMDAVPSSWRNTTTVLASLDRETRLRLLDNRLRLMLSASEPLLSDVPRTWIFDFGHRARHVHMFGQTETAGIVCLNNITVSNDAMDVTSLVPIGRPIANTEIYILDEELQRVPVGEAGELYISGAGVGRGYLNRPHLTAEKFLSHPFSDQPGARLYRTGDWARLRPDGKIEFAGRRDSQVKVRGFRVELGEIEATLARHPGVKENAVVARTDASGTTRLIAYFVSMEPAPGVSELREFMANQVPDYLVPSAFLELNELPLNVNGKVDRRTLPDPGEMRPDLATSYQSPRNPLEELLAHIWSEVLDVEGIGVDDNFFELGGHSLLATQVIARVNDQFKTVIPLRLLFESPTIAGLAAGIATASERASDPSTSLPKLRRVNRGVEAPLSFAQQRLWFIDQMDPGSALYNVNRSLRLQGQLDATRLEQAVQAIAERHEVLRTTFVAQDGRPIQRIAPSIELPFNQHDLRSTPAGSREEKARELLQAETEMPFDLTKGPLARVTLVRIDDDEHLLLLSIHHIIADGWSLSVFFDELTRFYLSTGEEFSELPIQYADYSHWQQESVATEAFARQLEYWRNQLAGAPTVLQLPTDHPRPSRPTALGAQRSVSISTTLSQAVREMSRREGVTLFMTLLTAFQILLAHYSGIDDLLIGVPVAGRTLTETEVLVGCFINTLVMRGDLSGHPSFQEVIKRTREVALEAYTNQEVPFEKLVEELRPERDPNRSPIFQILFALQDERGAELTIPGVKASVVPLEIVDSKFELSMEVFEKAEGLDVSLSYSMELFDPSSIETMLGDYELVLKTIVANPAGTLAELPAMGWTPRVQPATAHTKVVSGDDTPSTQAIVAPRTPIEERLCAIWSEVLKVDHVGVHDNFFSLGGHSLLAAQVISRTRNTFAVEIPLRRIFETPTVAGLAAAIYQTQTNEAGDKELAAMLAELSLLSEEEAEHQFAEES